MRPDQTARYNLQHLARLVSGGGYISDQYDLIEANEGTWWKFYTDAHKEYVRDNKTGMGMSPKKFEEHDGFEIRNINGERKIYHRLYVELGFVRFSHNQFFTKEEERDLFFEAIQEEVDLKDLSSFVTKIDKKEDQNGAGSSKSSGNPSTSPSSGVE